jgi:NTP pyrophosphatase (non-canonical NTP hydrolase)
MDVLLQLRAASKKRQHIFDDKEWSLPEWGNATAGEVGELCNVIKKIHRGDYTLKEANEKELIADEAADVVIYLDLLCQKAGVSLLNAIVNKFNKSSEKIGCPEVNIYYY